MNLNETITNLICTMSLITIKKKAILKTNNLKMA
jgi:hypothetical protein